MWGPLFCGGPCSAKHADATYLFLLTMHVGTHVVIILNSINISVILMLGSTF